MFRLIVANPKLWFCLHLLSNRRKMNNADKIYKKSIKDQQRRLKPGECEKYVRLIIEQSFSNSSLGKLVVLELSNTNVKTRSTVENCFYWERNVNQRQFISNDDLALVSDMHDEWQMENQVMKLLSKWELEYHVKKKSLSNFCKQFKKEFPDKQHTLLIPYVKDKDEGEYNAISKALVELQILEDVSILEYKEHFKELANLFRRFTKAIAEIPFKQQKSENTGAFKKYLANDKKQCVRVVGTAGLARLWQQHLNRLPNVTSEVAEAIIAEYKCPKHLLAAYKDNTNAVDKIANIKLNRCNAPKPLQSERRIGNVLSEKLFTLYNTRDPNACL